MKQGKARSLGINGMGRIGKLTLWHHVGRKFFDRIIVNLGRHAGTSLDDIAHYLERDSTYGALHTFLHGQNAEPVISDIKEQTGEMRINGIPVRILRKERNPANIGWRDQGVKIVVDTTGNFLDPTLPADHPKGSLRGHIASGAEKVIASAPFKIKDKNAKMPEDALTTVMGINDKDYDPAKHLLISNASCTTTCLAHMIKPLLDYFGHKKILSASMATVHSVTSSQSVLDKLPKEGATDLRKTRSIFNNIILTTTGAAKALKLAIPEMGKIGFIAESIRIPTVTGSLIVLVLNFQEESDGKTVTRELIRDVYLKAAGRDRNKRLLYTDSQNVSSDIIGNPRAAAVIEGGELQTTTAEITVNLESVPGLNKSMLSSLPDTAIRIPVTQAVIYGWYDNEMGSYVNMLGDRCVSIAEKLTA